MKGFRGHSSLILIRKNQYFVALALVSPKRNNRSRAQTSIFTVENQHVLVQMAPQASWPRDVPAESLEARSPQPGVFSQAFSARIPQPRVLSKDSSARRSQSGILSQESSAKSPQPGFLSQQSPANLFGVRAGVKYSNLLADCHVTCGADQMKAMNVYSSQQSLFSVDAA